MRRRSTKHHPNIAEIVQSAQHLELLEVSTYIENYIAAPKRDRFAGLNLAIREGLWTHPVQLEDARSVSRTPSVPAEVRVGNFVDVSGLDQGAGYQE